MMLPPSISSVLCNAKRKIPALEADILLAYVLKKPRSFLYSSSEKKLTVDELNQFLKLIERRLQQEPIAYIIGQKEFFSLDFEVTQATLIPRPETELLVEFILNTVNEARLTLADIGTGSGAIAIAIAKQKPNWRILASDISEAALKVAEINANKHEVTNISFYLGDLLAPLPQDELLDVIVSNPPYLSEEEWRENYAGLKYEPKNALVSDGSGKGCNGLVMIKELVESSKNYLKSKGLLILEHGYLQGVLVRDIFAAAEFSEVQTLRDLAGHERLTFGRVK